MATSGHEVFALREPLQARCAKRWEHWAHREECPAATHCCKWIGKRLGKRSVYRSFVCVQCVKLFAVRWGVKVKAKGKVCP